MYEKAFARRPKAIFDASGNTSSHWQDLQDIMRLCRQYGIEPACLPTPTTRTCLICLPKLAMPPGLSCGSTL